MLIIFDLDDTLVCGKKPCVPKQTYHTLRALKAQGHTLVIVTYNALGHFVANSHGLFKYIDALYYLENPKERSDLILVVLFYHQLNEYPFASFMYFDDRKDNIQNVQSQFPTNICVHVQDPLQLFAQVKQHISV